MPDTALFENGKVKVVFRSDGKEGGCLTQNKNKMNLQELRRTFSMISRERRKEQLPQTETNMLALLSNMVANT